MLKIYKSPEAENDLDEIWLYIAQDNPDCADKLLDAHRSQELHKGLDLLFLAGNLDSIGLGA